MKRPILLVLARVVGVGALVAFGCVRSKTPAPAPSADVVLGEHGVARFPVVVAPTASTRTLAAAQRLATTLSRMTGASFHVESGDGTHGLAVGIARDFPRISTPTLGDDDYVLRSYADGVHVLGGSDDGVEDAVSDLEHRLGHRRFFAGARWEIFPKLPVATISVDVVESPSFACRAFGFGYDDEGAEVAAENDAWRIDNRLRCPFAFAGHAYEAIIARHRAEFAAHPEYLCPAAAGRAPSKFRISDANLRELVADDARTWLAAHPDARSYSVEPSDGGDWCDDDASRALGSISDQVVTLANDVARAIHPDRPDVLVNFYAYNFHSPPPSLAAEPNVVVNVATAFIQGGRTIDQQLAGWGGRVHELGVRDYLAVNAWDRDLPGISRASDPASVATNVRRFHDAGARHYVTEATDGFVASGLGDYVASRVLWDVDASDDVEALRDDFLTRAFGDAAGPAREFFRAIDGATHPLASDDLLARLFSSLDDARKATSDADVRARIGDLVLYTHYLELWTAYASSSGAARQAAFVDLLAYAVRIRDRAVIASRALYRDLPTRDRDVTLPADVLPTVPEASNPWFRQPPPSDDEIDAMLGAGLAAHHRLDFTPVSFSDALVPLGPDRGNAGHAPCVGDFPMMRGTARFHTWAPSAPATFTLDVSGGQLYTTLGDVTLALYPAADPTGAASDTATVPPDKTHHTITLRSPFSGAHVLEIRDGSAGTLVDWPVGQPMTIVGDAASQLVLAGRADLCFYVPRGTKVVGGYAAGVGDVVDGDGKTLLSLPSSPGYFEVPVPADGDDAVWRLAHTAGPRILMTAPPSMARRREELLVPAEVVAL